MANQQNTKAQKAQKEVRKADVFESLKGIGETTAKAVSDDLIKETSKDFLRQLLGQKMGQNEKHYSGEVARGEDLEMDSIYSGQRQEQEKLQKQLSFERRLRDEESSLIERKSQELRLQLNAIMQEIKAVAASTPQLVEEVQVAMEQAPANPGIYHIFFFEKLLEFISNFKKNIEGANSWLHSANSRAQKKSFWGVYKSKQGGAKRLLSSEDYSQRSAG